MSLISCRDLSLSYGRRKVIDSLSFSLSAGERLCIVGENGSGKSTLIRALCSLISPDSGEICYQEGVVGGIGYLPQKEPSHAYFPATVGEVVSSGLSRGGLWLTKSEKAKIRETMELFDIESLSDKNVSDLSGGQRQRALLARAFLSAESVLLLDEPVTGLDPLITHELYHRIRALSRTGLAVAMVTHDVSAALDFCTHVLHLARGKAAFYGTVEEYRFSAAFSAFAGEGV